MAKTIRFGEARSGLSARAVLLDDKAPASCDFLWRYLDRSREIPSLHAMWTGPEISCPIPDAEVPAADRDVGLPLENGTTFPAAGDILLAYVPPRAWGGIPAPVFDIGLFYGSGGRMLLPIGWVAASLCAQIVPDDLPGAAEACTAIRRNGACVMTLERVDE